MASRGRDRTDAGSGIRRVVIVFKSHFDFGFTDLPESFLDFYFREMIPKAIRVWEGGAGLPRGERFVWTVPAWVLYKAVEHHEGSETGRRLDDAIGGGGISWHALPFTTHTESLGVEELVRGLRFSRALSERYGIPCRAAKMTDVPGHTWIVPHLLHDSGVTFLHLGCNSCSTPPDLPVLFNWLGPTGKGVLTMYSKGGYGTGHAPPADWKHPVWLTLPESQDNEPPQDAETVRRTFEETRRRFPAATVQIGTLDDFAGLIADAADRVPTRTADLADSWIHGLGAVPAQIAGARDVRNRLLFDEAAATLYLDNDDRLARKVDDAYEQLLIFGEHSFGMDSKLALNPADQGGRIYDKARFLAARNGGAYAKLTTSWQSKADHVREARTAAEEVEAALGRSCDSDDAVEAGNIGVFNPHPWEFSGPVDLGPVDDLGEHSPDSEGGAGTPGVEFSVTNLSTNVKLDCFVRDGHLIANLDAIPPIGSSEVEVRHSEGPPRAPDRPRQRGVRRIDVATGFFELSVDPGSGAVDRLLDKRSGKDWVQPDSDDGLGTYRYDVFGRREIVAYLKSYAYDLEDWYLADFGKPGYPPIDHLTFRPNHVESTVFENDGYREIRTRFVSEKKAHDEYGDASEIERIITLYEKLPWLDMEFRLTDKQATQYLESAHVCLPFDLENARWAIAKTGTVIDPAKDIARNANRWIFCCDGWVDVSDGSYGMLVVPLHTPLLSLGEIGIERFDGDRIPSGATAWFNLFNTQWGTNFPQWVEGDLVARFRLVPHSGGWQECEAWRTAAVTQQPPKRLSSGRRSSSRKGASPRRTAESRPAYGNRPPLLRSSHPSLRMLSLRPAQRSLLLRLQDASGTSHGESFHFGPEVLRADRLDLLDRDIAEAGGAARAHGSVPAHGDGGAIFSVHFRPFEIVTLRLSLREPAENPAP